MKDSIHPKYTDITIRCNCGYYFVVGSTLDKDLDVEICSQCHPFYTGTQKMVSSGGRVQKFIDRYKLK
ncbi:50S ribosomal protein L31 [Candidatus Legionella polyplacis]|uniref:50S ribosomal protein L31 n=1 Tax=Candidatus Legionella polyplacis TaxID=2005262 RepID=A0ABZ2GVF6_9GAMM|nr:50S ribosomal protein L31 [Candidatus Legionella polyplacis]ATW01967.1 50S ribosomal protein L31 [Candidatus Legionella polyplacis]